MRPRGGAPSETPYRATGTIYFLAPDFGFAAAFGLSNNVAPGFSYNSDRTTGGVKVSLLDTEVGTVRVTAAADVAHQGHSHVLHEIPVEALEDLLAIAFVAFRRLCVGKASLVTSSVVRTASERQEEVRRHRLVWAASHCAVARRRSAMPVPPAQWY